MELLKLLSAREMAEATGYSAMHLRLMHQQELLDATYDGDELRFYESDVEWLRARKARGFGRPNKEDEHG